MPAWGLPSKIILKHRKEAKAVDTPMVCPSRIFTIPLLTAVYIPPVAALAFCAYDIMLSSGEEVVIGNATSPLVLRTHSTDSVYLAVQMVARQGVVHRRKILHSHPSDVCIFCHFVASWSVPLIQLAIERLLRVCSKFSTCFLVFNVLEAYTSFDIDVKVNVNIFLVFLSNEPLTGVRFSWYL